MAGVAEAEARIDRSPQFTGQVWPGELRELATESVLTASDDFAAKLGELEGLRDREIATQRRARRRSAPSVVQWPCSPAGTRPRRAPRLRASEEALREHAIPRCEAEARAGQNDYLAALETDREEITTRITARVAEVGRHSLSPLNRLRNALLELRQLDHLRGEVGAVGDGDATRPFCTVRRAAWALSWRACSRASPRALLDRRLSGRAVGVRGVGGLAE